MGLASNFTNKINASIESIALRGGNSNYVFNPSGLDKSYSYDMSAVIAACENRLHLGQFNSGGVYY
jgi:hypothetical protein